ncbi:MAG TPA: TIGR02996 domain-containing protein [Gemmataceae bacterium]|nr:TIGR02996 domain-containing protein [Gemmataceae bacterium]
MSDREALLAAALVDPADDTARLVLADFLQENGEPELGRFVWAGVTASRFRGAELIEDLDYYHALRELSAVAAAGHPADWVAALGLGLSPLTPRDWAWDSTVDRVTVRVGQAVGAFERGMLAGLTLNLGGWYEVAGRALSVWPVERVTTADVPGLSFTVSAPTPARPGWMLTGVLRVPGRRVPLTGAGLIVSALAPTPFLVEPAEEWRVEEGFLDRAALVAGVAGASQRVVEELREIAADRWPSPPRRR